MNKKLINRIKKLEEKKEQLLTQTNEIDVELKKIIWTEKRRWESTEKENVLWRKAGQYFGKSKKAGWKVNAKKSMWRWRKCKWHSIK